MCLSLSLTCSLACKNSDGTDRDENKVLIAPSNEERGPDLKRDYSKRCAPKRVIKHRERLKQEKLKEKRRKRRPLGHRKDPDYDLIA